jgi:UDP-N-acetylglucosamine 2-epimerase
MHVMTVLGARPQFIKAAPLCFALRDAGVRESLVHTGQHYDDRMSEIFFRELGIPRPAVNLGIGSGSHAHQTGAMLIAIEDLLLAEKPDLLLVYGDTNSTLAGALAAAKLCIPIAHVEAGLRSFNRTMPEETNRVLTDRCASLLFCPTETAVDNLAAEGVRDGVHLVGDTMYDALLRFAPVAKEKSRILDDLDLRGRRFLLATLHRPYNVDTPEVLAEIFAAFARLDLPVVFPVHPRTLARIREFGLALPANLRAVEPLGYLDMLALLHAAALVMTDSGGVQKEAGFAGAPCVTLRPETEWVETVDSGWNRLAWGSADAIVAAVLAQLTPPERPLMAYGDGHAAEKIAAILASRGGGGAA